MSVSILKREIINKLIPKAWGKKKKTIGIAARQLVERGNDLVTNLLVLDKARVDYLYEVFSAVSTTELSKSEFESALIKKLGRPYKIKDQDLKKLVGDVPVFKVGTGFDSFKATLNLLFNKLSETTGKNFFQGKQFDHGEQGSAFSSAIGSSLLMSSITRKTEFKGNAVAQNDFAQKASEAAIERLRNLDDTWKQKLIDAYGNQYETRIQALIEKVLVRWNTVASKSATTLKAKLELVITPAEASQRDKAFVEKKILYDILIGGIEDALEAYARNPGYERLRGSSTIEEKVGKILIEQLKPRIKIRNGKVILRINSKIDKAALGEITTLVSKSFGKNKVTQSEKPSTPKPRIRVKDGKPVLPDIRTFIGIINTQLSKQVASNMGTPRLNYRTGRFANSATVTNVIYSKTGIPTIDYTYMRYPYEVFEYPGSGSPLAQQGQRDPRPLIDESIRDIMAKFAVGRFNTRRV